MADTANRESWTRPRDLGPELLEGPRSLGDCARSPKARNCLQRRDEDGAEMNKVRGYARPPPPPSGTAS